LEFKFKNKKLNHGLYKIILQIVYKNAYFLSFTVSTLHKIYWVEVRKVLIVKPRMKQKMKISLTVDCLVPVNFERLTRGELGVYYNAQQYALRAAATEIKHRSYDQS
jgi:hypothetical protein